MIVDEDVVELNRLSLILGFKGYEVYPLHHSYKVFTEITRFRPDMILLNSQLNNMNSHAVSRALKSIVSSKNIPLVLISTIQGEENFTYSVRKNDVFGSRLKTGDLDVVLWDLELDRAS
jgi:PleD family two-component response regulator